MERADPSFLLRLRLDAALPERLSEFVASKSKMGIALVRPTAVYGRWTTSTRRRVMRIPALVRRAVAHEDPFEVWGTGDEVRDFHVTDLIRGSLLLLANHASATR